MYQHVTSQILPQAILVLVYITRLCIINNMYKHITLHLVTFIGGCVYVFVFHSTKHLKNSARPGPERDICSKVRWSIRGMAKIAR